MAAKTTRRIDYPMVLLYLGAGVLCVYALEHVPWERVESMPVERIALIASMIVNGVTMAIGAFRGKAVETVGTVAITRPIPITDPPPPEAP